MNKLMIVAMALAAIGLSACTSTDSARVDQAPYAHERTVGATKEPVRQSDTVFHSRQAK